MRRIFMSALVALNMPAPATAAPECKGSLGHTEILICSSEMLLQLAEEQSRLEARLDAQPRNKELAAARNRKEGWLRLKNGCITQLCLRSVLEERIQELKKALDRR
jgi:uncharacterized protein